MHGKSGELSKPDIHSIHKYIDCVVVNSIRRAHTEASA